jgi:hypothetical protein
VDNNSFVWHNWQTSPGGGWRGWSEIPGKRLKPGFVVGQNKDGRLVVIGVGASTQDARTGSRIKDPNAQHVWSVWQQTANGVFAMNWTDMGGSNLDPKLIVGNTAGGGIQLFGTGPNKDLWSNKLDTGDRWMGWTAFGGKEVKVYASQSAGK